MHYIKCNNVTGWPYILLLITYIKKEHREYYEMKLMYTKITHNIYVSYYKHIKENSITNQKQNIYALIRITKMRECSKI